jgi:hypothetical protein
MLTAEQGKAVTKRRQQHPFAHKVMTLPEDTLLSHRELAADLHVTSRTLTTYANMPDGIPSIAWGLTRKYRVGSVRKWLLARERTQ